MALFQLTLNHHAGYRPEHIHAEELIVAAGFLWIRMKFFRFSYVGAVLAGAVLTISGRYFVLVSETSKLKNEVIYLQQIVEARNLELVSKRQQLQAQQEKLLKGSAISETVGPAVVRDIAALAEKPGNPRLRDLLAKHGIQVTAAASNPGGAVPPSARKGGN